MARSDPQVNFRISEALLEEIKASAKATGRSLSAEINWRLTASFVMESSDDLEHQLAAKRASLSKAADDLALVQDDYVDRLAAKIAQALATNAANEDGKLVTRGAGVKRLDPPKKASKKAKLR